MKFRLLFVLLAALLVVPVVGAQDANLTAACVESFDPDADYFPDKITVEYAQGFTVEYFSHYKLVTVLLPWQGADAPLQYLLVQCGTPAPEGYADTPVIEVPSARFVSMSTSFLPHIVSQGLLDRLVAIDTPLYTINPDVLARVEAGDVVEIGGGGSGAAPNVEALIDLEPDLVLTQRFSADDTNLPVLEQAGLPVVVNADFLDTSPLGQAEWGKFIALFFNTEALAEETFAGVESRYQELAALAAGADDKPTVLATTPFGDTWFLPGGASYLARLLADAGAAYLWAHDESTGSLFLDWETVLDRAVDADFWLNTFQTTLDELLAADERFADFTAVQNGTVYTNNARQSAGGGSDYYEAGQANPDIILADLIHILHPDLLPDHELYFYKPLAPAGG